MTRPNRRCGNARHGQEPWLSIIIPVLDEAAILVDTLSHLEPLRAQGAEVIVVDGGSRDDSASIARPLVDSVLASARGRAVQMNAGARAARGSVLLFLHADTRLPPGADRAIASALAQGDLVWGRFDVRLSGDRFMLRLVAFFMNQRSRVTGIATGDQGMFVRRDAFEKVGGFPPVALMEDVALAARLKRESPPLRLRARVLSSSRKWEREGVLRTIWLMWRLRLAFRCGADPSALARRYYRDRQTP